MNSEDKSDEYGSNIKEAELFQNVLSKRDSHLRRVSFPENDTDLVTGYLEPVDPLRLAINVDKEELLRAYELSCQRHNTSPIESVLDQIKALNIDNDRSDSFSLSNITLTCSGCESLEEVFKRVQFARIELADCGLTSRTASALFEMLEYYESAIHLHISNNLNLEIRGWLACANYIKKSNTLEELEIRDIRLAETELDCLVKPLAHNRHLQILKLENCNIIHSGMRSLVSALTTNSALKELCLADNKLDIFEATLLGTLLKTNRNLQLLDLSNNHIQDAGLNHIVLGLCSQKFYGGLEVLVLWNNYLTSACSLYIDKLLRDYRGLTILNVGCNNLSDSFVLDIKDSLKQNETLLRLGLQSTKLTCTSAVALAEALNNNKSIERIDLRENSMESDGLSALSNCLDINSTVIQIDLNEFPTWKHSDDYKTLVNEIKAKCVSNKLKEPSPVIGTENTHLTAHRSTSRKISLTCQTLTQEPFPVSVSSSLFEPKKAFGKLRSPAPSPIPSPVSSPVPLLTTKSRFSVSRVSESECRRPAAMSRFTVTVIEPPKAVSSNSGAVTVGFDCSAPTPPTTVSAPSDKEQTVAEKPLTSLEKLLSLFQNHKISSVEIKTDSMTDKTDVLAKQCDNIKLFPFSNMNLSKNLNSSNVSGISESNMDVQSMKENISPEHCVPVAGSKKFKQQYGELPDESANNQSALDFSSGRVKHEFGRGQLCSSSEDSDSGIAALESSSSSNMSAIDSGISDDSVASYDVHGASTVAVAVVAAAASVTLPPPVPDPATSLPPSTAHSDD